MPARPRPFLARFTQAVLAGSAVALLVPLLAVVIEFASLPLLLPDGTPHDAYTHTITTTLMAWPVLYLVVAVAHAVLFYLLARLRLLRWPVATGLPAALVGAGLLALGTGALAATAVAASFAAGGLVVWRVAVPKAQRARQGGPGLGRRPVFSPPAAPAPHAARPGAPRRPP